MREILFRGKRIDNGEWVEGDLIWANYLPVQAFISSAKSDITRLRKISTDGFSEWRADQVIPETVGQYTGLKDKNGKMIFEGDVVKWEEKEWGSAYSEVVTWDYELLSARKNDWHDWCEIIGNIHDNPELLKEGVI